MKDVKKRNKIWFIVLVSIFSVLWITSLVFLGISCLNEAATESIESWYAQAFSTETKKVTLNLLNTSLVCTGLSLFGLLVVLLFKELKKKYNVR